ENRQSDHDTAAADDPRRPNRDQREWCREPCRYRRPAGARGRCGPGRRIALARARPRGETAGADRAMTKIKICGNTRPEDVELAVELGVDLLGFIFTRSKRQVGVEDARRLIAGLPDGVQRVGVFTDEPPEQIAEVAQACGLTAIQVYRPLTE